MDRFNFAKITEVLRKNLMNGLDPSKRWHFIHCPKDIEVSDLRGRIEAFIKDHLDKWVEMISKVIPYITEKDIASLSHAEPTPRALEFRALHDFLELHRIPSAESFKQDLSLWSGDKAREKAMRDPGTRCDSQIPTIGMMFALVDSILEAQEWEYDALIRMLTNGTSRLFCLNAKEISHVFISSDKASEPAGFTRDNNFWTDEFPTLRSLLSRGATRDVLIHLYDHKTESWSAPKSLASSKISLMDMSVTRREAYAFRHTDSCPASSSYASILESEDDPRFKTSDKSEDQRKLWAKSAPRPALTVGQLKAVARKWRAVAHQRVAAKREAAAGGLSPV